MQEDQQPKKHYQIPSGVNYGKTVVISSDHNVRFNCKIVIDTIDAVRQDPFLAQLVNVKVGDVVLRGNRHYRVNRIDMIRNPSS